MTEVNQMKQKQLKSLLQEAGDLLAAYKYDEAYTLMGQLNALLKDKETLAGIPSTVLDAIEGYKKSYYYQNNVVNKAHKAMSAIGHKLQEAANM